MAMACSARKLRHEKAGCGGPAGGTAGAAATGTTGGVPAGCGTLVGAAEARGRPQALVVWRLEPSRAAPGSARGSCRATASASTAPRRARSEHPGRRGRYRASAVSSPAADQSARRRQGSTGFPGTIRARSAHRSGVVRSYHHLGFGFACTFHRLVATGHSCPTATQYAVGACDPPPTIRRSTRRIARI